jgi:cell division septal protein FtsQ
MKRFLFWRIIQFPNQMSAAIAERLAVAVREVNHRGFTCCGIVTDSTSNEKHALHAKSVQHLT